MDTRDACGLQCPWKGPFFITSSRLNIYKAFPRHQFTQNAPSAERYWVVHTT